MNIQGLIERYEKFKTNKKKLTSVDLVLKDLRSLDEPEPLPFKLKDVVGRIRGFDPSTQAIWLNTILKELGNDYGLMKYRSGYDQGLLDGAWVGNQLKDADKIRQELNKVLLPEFMYDWVFDCQLLRNFSLSDALDSNTIHLFAKKSESVKKWLKDKKNQELFARAWIEGYEVEKEKIYTVKVKAVLGQYLGKYYLNNEELTPQFIRTQFTGKEKLPTFTRKELEESGFGWVFDCEGIEIEEVE